MPPAGALSETEMEDVVVVFFLVDVAELFLVVLPVPDASAVPEPDASAVPEPDASAVPESDASAVPDPDASAVPDPDASAVPDAVFLLSLAEADALLAVVLAADDAEAVGLAVPKCKSQRMPYECASKENTD